MDSSSYTIAAGQTVTFTVRLMGNGTTPTGTVAFKAGGNVINGCSAIAVANGQALCTTNSLGAGSWPITGAYSGDSVYGSGVAGPITQTVTGAPAALGLSIDSSRYTANLGQPVTFTVRVTGGSAPSGTVRFTDGSANISGCTAVVLSSGTATCTTKALGRGQHRIRGYYSGDSRNSAGVAGPITETIN